MKHDGPSMLPAENTVQENIKQDNAQKIMYVFGHHPSSKLKSAGQDRASTNDDYGC